MMDASPIDSRRLLGLLACVCIASTTAVAAPSLDSCLTVEGEALAACIDTALESAPLRAPELEALLDRVPAEAAAILALLDSIDRSRSAALAADPRLAAAALDLRGRALHTLGRHDDSAAALTSAVELDDGTSKLVWTPRSDGASWTAALGASRDRLEWTVRALIAAGRTDRARGAAARLLSLGAEGWVEEAWESVGGGVVPGLDTRTAMLSTSPWHEPLPDVNIPMVRGEYLPLSKLRGKVVILDFWATWCDPCVRELPRLQELYDAEKERGLFAVAVNYRETETVATRFAEDLGLTLPIGLANLALDRHFEVRSLPTLFLADRHGRVRGRWNGYREGFEDEIAEAARALLSEETEAPVDLARVLRGGGMLEVAWTREAPMMIEGVGVVSDGAGRSRVVATLGREVTLLDADGELDRRAKLPAAVTRLRAGDLDGDGAEELIGYRPGGRQVLVLRPGSEGFDRWEAGSPIFDLDVLPGADAHAAGAEVVMGTLAGLERLVPAGGSLHAVDGYREVSDVAVLGGSPPTVVALEAGRRVSWLDRELRPLQQREVPEESWVLAAGERGVATAPYAVQAIAAGRLLDDGAVQVAVALDGMQLVLLDLDSGAERFRARWKGIRDLAVGDIDGDGRDELIVGAGYQVSVIRAARSAPPASSM
jgi:thiol-disulfide isomerase/thioredoxin